MILPESNTNLNRWLPKLEQYRASLESAADATPLKPVEALETALSFQTPEAEKATDASSDASLLAQSLVSDNQVDEAHASVLLPFPTTLPSSDRETTVASAFSIVHLPVDGILKQIKKSNPYVLGMVTVGNIHDTQVSDSIAITHQIVSQLADRLHQKTDRATLVIRVQPKPLVADHLEKRPPTAHSHHFITNWIDFDDSKVEKQKWYSQISDLTTWKQEFGLIVLDLGNAGSPSVGKLGRLCDGVVGQVLGLGKSKSTLRQLKSLNTHRLQLLGVWSMESASIAEAA